jgi:hypothetical protein
MKAKSLFGIRIFAGAAVLLATPAMADVKAGVDAWGRGDYRAAITEWEGPAQKGDPDAQFNLAQAYKLGRGVKQDLKRAEELYGKAAARGHSQASDNYGLLMFQRGDREKAMPYIIAASRRGDPRAQYILGLAHFNGDTVQKDWVRAYALVSLARQAGLPQAIPALDEMNKHISLEERQRSVELATRIAAEAQALRSSQAASADLGGTMRPAGSSGVMTSMSSAAVGAPAAIPRMPAIAAAQKQLSEATPAPSSPATAGADYARPAPPPVAITQRPAAAPRPAPAAASPAASPAPAPAPQRGADGPWRVQLGAFGVAGNAQRLWNRVKDRPELAGHPRLLVPAGRVSKLQAGGFASQSAAQAACNRLSAAGFDCLAVRN